jgi:hypothetical protein
MPALNIPYAPNPGDPEDVTQINANFEAIRAVVNALDDANIAAAGLGAASLAAAVVEALGLNDGASVRRGKSIIATEEARTNVAYGLLTTPDRVQSVVLPTDGLLAVLFMAEATESVAGAGRASIFVGSTQLRVASHGQYRFIDDTVGQEASLQDVDGADIYNILTTFPGGLVGGSSISTTNTVSGEGDNPRAVAIVSASGTPYVARAGTVDLDLGGVCLIEAAAGSYDVSVQFKSSSGSVTVKNRKLWVEARGF